MAFITIRHRQKGLLADVYLCDNVPLAALDCTLAPVQAATHLLRRIRAWDPSSGTPLSGLLRSFAAALVTTEADQGAREAGDSGTDDWEGRLTSSLEIVQATLKDPKAHFLVDYKDLGPTSWGLSLPDLTDKLSFGFDLSDRCWSAWQCECCGAWELMRVLLSNTSYCRG